MEVIVALIVFFGVAWASLTAPPGFMDLDEVTSVKYDISIGNQPILLGSDAASSEMVRVVDYEFEKTMPTLIKSSSTIFDINKPCFFLLELLAYGEQVRA